MTGQDHRSNGGMAFIETAQQVRTVRSFACFLKYSCGRVLCLFLARPRLPRGETGKQAIPSHRQDHPHDGNPFSFEYGRQNVINKARILRAQGRGGNSDHCKNGSRRTDGWWFWAAEAHPDAGGGWRVGRPRERSDLMRPRFSLVGRPLTHRKKRRFLREGRKTQERSRSLLRSSGCSPRASSWSARPCAEDSSWQGANELPPEGCDEQPVGLYGTVINPPPVEPADFSKSPFVLSPRSLSDCLLLRGRHAAVRRDQGPGAIWVTAFDCRSCLGSAGCRRRCVAMVAAGFLCERPLGGAGFPPMDFLNATSGAVEFSRQSRQGAIVDGE